MLKSYNHYIGPLMITLGSFFIPIYPLVVLVGIFVLADTIFGLVKARKLGIPITSRKLSNIISKTFLYQGVVLLSFFLDYFLLNEFVILIFSMQFLVSKLMTLMILYIEIKSIDENFKSITGIHLWDTFKKMITRASEVKEDIKKII